MTRRIEHAVILTAADCALLHSAAQLSGLRRAARGKSERLYSILTDVTAAAYAHHTSVSGTKPQVRAETRQARSVEMITVSDIAERAGITPRGVRNHIRNGLLTAHKINGSWLIDADTAEQYLAGRQAG